MLPIIALALAGGAFVEPPPPTSVPMSWGTAPHVIYLNPNGGIVEPGQISDSRTNTSPLVPGPAQIAPFAWGQAAWSQFVSCVRDEYAPFNITVTDVDPGAVDHIEAFVGGAPGEIGQPQGVAGYATSYCGAIDTDAVVFVFPEAIPFGDVQTLCEITAQETAHPFALDHEYLCSDPMSYCPPGAHKTFQDQDAYCGEYGPRPCRCGQPAQNSYQQLLAALGPSTGEPPPPNNPQPQPPPQQQPPPPPVYQPQPLCSAGGSPSSWFAIVPAIVFALRRRRLFGAIISSR